MNGSEGADRDELRAMRSRWERAARDWDLTGEEGDELAFGDDGPADAGRIETRMRMLVEVDRELPSEVRGTIASWLRSPHPSLDGATPLKAMRNSIGGIRRVRGLAGSGDRS